MHGFDQLLTPQYIWLFIGLFLYFLERLFSGYFFIFFSMGTLFASLASFLFHPDLAYQLIIFFPSSLLSLMIIRPRIKAWTKTAYHLSAMTYRIPKPVPGITAIADTDIIPGTIGKIKVNTEVKDAASKDEIKKGDVVRLTKTNTQVFEVKFLERF